MARRTGLWMGLLCVLGCDRGPTESSPARRPASVAAVSHAFVESAPSPCDQRMGALLSEPALPGVPEFDGQRSRILARAKGSPVVLVARPEADRAGEAARLRTRIESAPTPAYRLYEIYPTLQRNRALAREVLLTDGYLYADSPGLAAALANVVRLEHLFDVPELWIQRGDRVFRVVRQKGEGGTYYAHTGGSRQGRRARILFLDRVSPERGALDAPLHRDLSPVARQLGFTEASLVHVTANAMLAKLRYGNVWVPSVLSTQGARVSFECESLPDAGASEAERARNEVRSRELLFSQQRRVIQRQIEEGLPFDEPKTEVGQQDGKLRQAWSWAYRYGRTTYEFNEDKYYVFDREGRPRVPQVCIDFITDTFERASGSWYGHRDQPRDRLRGRLDFSTYGMENQRSVENFVAFAEANPQWFDVWHVPEEERVPLVRRREFYDYLYRHRAAFRPGDVVTILGLRDDGKMHYHSFFVYQADPITGMPTLVAANAGRPRIRSWDNEMSNAPLRSIKTRIRPRLIWLESVIPAHESETAEWASADGTAPI